MSGLVWQKKMPERELQWAQDGKDMWVCALPCPALSCGQADPPELEVET